MLLNEFVLLRIPRDNNSKCFDDSNAQDTFIRYNNLFYFSIQNICSGILSECIIIFENFIFIILLPNYTILVTRFSNKLRLNYFFP
jgi:hypothetical protein